MGHRRQTHTAKKKKTSIHIVHSPARYCWKRMEVFWEYSRMFFLNLVIFQPQEFAERLRILACFCSLFFFFFFLSLSFLSFNVFSVFLLFGVFLFILVLSFPTLFSGLLVLLLAVCLLFHVFCLFYFTIPSSFVLLFILPISE